MFLTKFRITQILIIAGLIGMSLCKSLGADFFTDVLAFRDIQFDRIEESVLNDEENSTDSRVSTKKERKEQAVFGDNNESRNILHKGNHLSPVNYLQLRSNHVHDDYYEQGNNNSGTSGKINYQKWDFDAGNTMNNGTPVSTVHNKKNHRHVYTKHPFRFRRDDNQTCFKNGHRRGNSFCPVTKNKLQHNEDHSHVRRKFQVAYDLGYYSKHRSKYYVNTPAKVQVVFNLGPCNPGHGNRPATVQAAYNVASYDRPRYPFHGNRLAIVQRVVYRVSNNCKDPYPYDPHHGNRHPKVQIVYHVGNYNRRSRNHGNSTGKIQVVYDLVHYNEEDRSQVKIDHHR